MTTILLVEDNEMNRDMLSRRLERKGYRIVMAVNGKGVDLAMAEKPALIPRDMSLPVLDGWEATRRIKADATTAAIPVIALTAHAMVQDKEKALAAGCAAPNWYRFARSRPVARPIPWVKRRMPEIDAETERLQKGFLAHLSQEFTAPALAIVSYTDMLIEDANRLSLTPYLEDLERIRVAGKNLYALLQSALTLEHKADGAVLD